MNLGVRTRAAAPSTYLFLTPNGSGAGIFGRAGTLVWWQKPPAGGHEQDAHVVHISGQPYLAVWSGSASTSTGSVGQVLLYDQHYRRVGVITAGPPYRADGIDLHEFRIAADGDAVVGVDHLVRRTVAGHSLTVVDYVVQKLSLVRDASGIHTGRVMFQWSSLKHVPPSQSYEPPPASGTWDYFHGNSVAEDTDGNLVVSARNTWGIYKINLRTGHIMWQVGAKGDHRLSKPWCYQHDITALGDGRYSLFDDAGDGPGCRSFNRSHSARGVIFRVEPSGQSRRPAVRLIHAYTHNPPIYSAWMGSIQALSDGRVLVGWGTAPQVTEYDAGGRTVDLDLSVSQASYRAFSSPWHGQPLTRPAVAATDGATGTDVWASWNGSTEVAAWRVLGGLSPVSLSAITGPTAKRGFETKILLSRHYAYVAVQALDTGGHVLRTSKAIRPSVT